MSDAALFRGRPPLLRSGMVGLAACAAGASSGSVILPASTIATGELLDPHLRPTLKLMTRGWGTPLLQIQLSLCRNVCYDKYTCCVGSEYPAHSL